MFVFAAVSLGLFAGFYAGVNSRAAGPDDYEVNRNIPVAQLPPTTPLPPPRRKPIVFQGDDESIYQGE